MQQHASYYLLIAQGVAPEDIQKRWIFCKKWPKAWWSYLNVPSCENCSRDKNLLLCVGVLQKLLRLIQSIEQEIDPDDSVTTAPVVPTALGCYHY
ncbi:uncharacterized protein PHALS_15483 [Plasmopara halstedii]|uniref:Uncharacterized protein n=1 Tax=Plasmopara halstedii TaxID=4781 RepID=A0A0N7L5B3_PLAHL|nr:uncharacterized protein PHALS_15483 [Plasmopara halstedii]CEG40995.1 hypothetical protein PHALS_15483 [Plasmopara halstedii]|eukprot:XP_024577364.1 hypothetical protein PHALS_15483 [Plasmopara halstedii]